MQKLFLLLLIVGFISSPAFAELGDDEKCALGIEELPSDGWPFKIKYTCSQGSVGVDEPAIIDSSALTAEQIRTINRLINLSRFFSLNLKPGPSASHFDPIHGIEIERGGRSHFVLVQESAGDENLSFLLNAIINRAQPANP